MLNAHNGKELWKVQISSFVYSAVFNPDGACIAIGDGDYRIHILDSKTGRLIRSFEEAHSDPVASLSFSRDGKYLLSAADMTICLWDFKSGKLVYQTDADGFARFVQFSPDGKSFAFVASDNAYIGAALTGKQILKLKKTEYEYYNPDVRSAVFSRDGKRIVTAGKDGNVCIWNASTGELEDEILQHFDYKEYEFTEEDAKRLYSEFESDID
jgi:WD40 repeat protein